MSDLKAMISSTALDLPEHRKQALDACLSLGVHPISMDYLLARDASAVAVSMEMVDRADIYVGIYAWRYGWIPKGSDISLTEMEFNRAVKEGKRILVFIMDDAHPIKRAEVEDGDAAQQKLKAFKARACDGRIRGQFKSPEDLKAQIILALADFKLRLKTESGANPLSPLHQLIPVPAAFTGRENELSYFVSALAKQSNMGAANSASGAVIQGKGGMGKSALASVLAHLLKDQYPDAQIYMNLRGFDLAGRKPMPPTEAMQKVIHDFHPEAKLPDTEAELTPIYNVVLNDAGRVLLFLDNAADAEQIRPLLPPANSLLLVTSRNQSSLPGLAARNLDCLPPEKSQELLLKLAPRLKGHECAAADLCGHLPLALKVFAGIVREKTLHPVEELLARLREHELKLDKVEAAFQVSYDLLEEPFRRCWTLLGIFPAGFNLPAAAAIWEMKTAESLDIMGGLLTESLVGTNEANDRFCLHDLVRGFCVGKLSGAERDTAMTRYAIHYTMVGEQADQLFLKGGADVVRGLELFDRERIHIEFAYEWLAPKRDEPSAALLVSLVQSVVFIGQSVRFHPRQRIGWLQSQRQAARISNDRQAEGNALGNLGIAYTDLGEPRKAIEFYEQTLAIHREIGDRRGEAADLGNLGIAYENLGEPRKAIGFYEQQLAITREIGDRRGEGNALHNSALAMDELGERAQAIARAEAAVAIFEAIKDPCAATLRALLEKGKGTQEK